MDLAPLKSILKRTRNYVRYPEVVAASLDGSTVRFEVSNDTERYRAESFGGEEAFLRAFLQYVGEGTVVWDVGANIGLYSLFAAEAGGTVHAFEPEPEFRSRLQENVDRNELNGRIQVHDFALGAEKEEMTLYTDGISGNSPNLAPDPEEDSQTETVTVRPGSSVSVTTPDIVKIDVEGAEMGVLEGLGGMLSDISVVALELHPEMIERFGSTIQEPIDRLVETGFEIAWENQRNEQRQLIAVRSSDS